MGRKNRKQNSKEPQQAADINNMRTSVSKATRLRDLWADAKSFFHRWLKRYMSFGFLVMLILSFIMWFIIKLDRTYTATVPFEIAVGKHEFRVETVVSGKGNRIFAYRYYRKKRLAVSWKELEISPSAVDPGAYVISPYSLQNAISRQTTELQIISLGTIPEIRYDGH